MKLNLGSGASAAAKKTLGGSFYDGLDPFQHAIATIAVYLGVYLAVSQGSKVLERWIGIDTNLSSGTKAGVATMAVGAMAARKWVAVLETSLLVGIIQLLADEIKVGLTVSEIVLVVEPKLV